MDKVQIDEIVRAVMQQLAGGPAVINPVSPAASPALNGDLEGGSLPDLGGEEFRTYLGVDHAKRPEVIAELRQNTASRVCTGRAGPRPRTTALLRFLADHSRSKDTVLKEVPQEWVQKKNLLELQSEITSKDQYLTRPDMGRRLSPASLEKLKSSCKQNPQVQVIISDGLSTDAVTANFDEILPPLLKGLESAGLDVGTPFFVRYGRVKVQDQAGEALGAKVVILLVGERPGLGQSESLSCYMVYSPTSQTVEADRTCLSNIHRGGTPPVEAAAVIVDLAKKMLEKKASGMALNR